MPRFRLFPTIAVVLACLLTPNSTSAQSWEPPIPQPLPEVTEQAILTYEIKGPSPDQHVVMTMTNALTTKVTFQGINEEIWWNRSGVIHALALVEAADVPRLADNYGRADSRHETHNIITIYQGGTARKISLAERSGRNSAPQGLIELVIYLRRAAEGTWAHGQPDIPFPFPKMEWAGLSSAAYTITFESQGHYVAFLQIQSNGTGYFRELYPPYVIETSLTITPALQARLAQQIKAADFFDVEMPSFTNPPPGDGTAMPGHAPWYEATITQGGRSRTVGAYYSSPEMSELFDTLNEIFDQFMSVPPDEQETLVEVQVENSAHRSWGMSISNKGEVFFGWTSFGRLSEEELAELIELFHRENWSALEGGYRRNPALERNTYTTVTFNWQGQAKKVWAQSGANVPPALDRVLAHLAGIYERVEDSRVSQIGIVHLGMPRSGYPNPSNIWPMLVGILATLVGLFIRRVAPARRIPITTNR
ncbi:MAG: hypothetical protein WCD37_17430 [Chloroflexia bacterium]